MVRVQKLTAETLIGAPRRSAAIPNHDGRLALYTISTHKFGDKTVKQVRVMDLQTRQSSQISDDDKVHDAVWVPGTNDILFLKSGDKDRTQAIVAKGRDGSWEHIPIAEFNGPIENLKLKKLDDGSVVFMVTGQVDDDGLLYNEEAHQKLSTGRIFDGARVRSWTSLQNQQPYTLWYNKLQQDSSGKWEFAGHLLNLVNNHELDAPGGMLDVGDPLSSFDISHRGAVFIAQDRTVLDPGEFAVSSAYFVPLDSFTLPPTGRPKRIQLPSGINECIMSNIRFSPDGTMIGFLHVPRGDEYDSRLLLASTNSLDAFDAFGLVTPTWGGGDKEHDPPKGFEFAGDSENIIMTSTNCGRTVLSKLKLADGEMPHIFFKHGSASAYYPLKDDNWNEVLVSSSSFIDSSLWQVVNVSEAAVVKTLSSATSEGKKFGLSPDMVTEFWYEGADDVCVHCFMLRPNDFDENKKYPWVLMPHGGPISSWDDAWSTRWNMAAWAEQGYIIVCPNITGSVGYGLEFARRINGEWGGRPFQDLLNLITYLEKLPYLDQDKAVLAGASYGGYMVSWMLGHEIINKFCGAIWHDGIFNLPSFFLQTDALYEGGNFEGALYPWQRPMAFERFNPARPELLRNWRNAPPTLVIHSEKDYRCPITEGIATYNTLKGNGVPSRLLIFPNEGHWVLDPENSLVWHKTVWDWVKRCVSGEIKRGDTKW
ncbi:prolyl oligopeptidase [Metarhizium guizhouense ARSEF 977]|uniref:Dipeptidyl-peptidase V n=1 Tax=Metarhizium guizhouense (strain ARSEF 977) TaxID=1276136 RepID=A0A0B4GWZ9_METGA|nr:prolyl oligopeptidase [Metarhizium guizhouense ARSEF 977]